MVCCRVCGDEKPPEEFFHIPYFSKYKKQKVQWCRACQRLWIDYKKEKEYREKYLQKPQFTVSFD